MINREKVIAGLKCCTDPDAIRCRECPYEDECRVIDGGQAVMADALELLTPRVLTLEEACGADECWFEQVGNPIECALARDYGEGMANVRLLQSWRDCVYPEHMYGVVWRCWTQEPTEAQREAEAWDGCDG